MGHDWVGQVGTGKVKACQGAFPEAAQETEKELPEPNQETKKLLNEPAQELG